MVKKINVDEIIVIVIISFTIFIGGFILGFYMGDERVEVRTRTITKQVVPAALTNEIKQLREDIFRENLPDNPDYRLCRWNDMCDDGQEYVELEWYEK